MRLKATINLAKRWAMRCYRYCVSGVWQDTRSTWWINLIKIINLSVNSFLDKNLQQKASALTYSTILAMVPVLAMIFAIGRGFGFQNLVETGLLKFIPPLADSNINNAYNAFSLLCSLSTFTSASGNDISSLIVSISIELTIPF